MGQSYDGVYLYGLVFDQHGDDEDNEGWPEVTRATLPDEEDGFDFDEWLRAHLGVPHYMDAFRDLPDPYAPSHEDARQAAYSTMADAVEARCIETFGVLFEDGGWLGYHEYPVYCVHPKGARLVEWRHGRVPDWSAEQIEAWRAACEKLRAALPGAGEPGLFFGCQVG